MTKIIIKDWSKLNELDTRLVQEVNTLISITKLLLEDYEKRHTNILTEGDKCN